MKKVIVYIYLSVLASPIILLTAQSDDGYINILNVIGIIWLLVFMCFHKKFIPKRLEKYYDDLFHDC